MEQYKITKHIRLIELFGGIGSQAKALERLQETGKLPIGFEHYRLVDYDKYPVASYNAIHGTNFEPMDITQIHASDLGIVDTCVHTYILTYSFPCQDISNVGLRKGFCKGCGTRSGLLWEVERLLNECDELPQVLLMENVPQIIGKRHIKDFYLWCDFLKSKGYSNYYKLLNAKDFGIPQNRSRCFMISILGDAYYEFPSSIPLKLTLQDMLEENVDDKYYLSPKMIQYIQSYNDKWIMSNAHHVVNRTIARTINTGEGTRRCDASNYIADNLPVNINISQFPDRAKLRIRRLTAKEALRLMGFDDEDFEKASKVNSNSQLYKQAGNSIVVNVLEAIFNQFI